MEYIQQQTEYIQIKYNMYLKHKYQTYLPHHRTAWFGAEVSPGYVPEGLWAVSYDSLLDFLHNNSFNVLRMPFCVDMIQKFADKKPPAGSINYQYNPELANLTTLEVYNFIVKAAGDRGIFVMLDMHRLNGEGQSALWYDNTHPPSMTNATWITVISQFTKQWNVFAVDIYNEPHGATWGDGNGKTDWTIWVCL